MEGGGRIFPRARNSNKIAGRERTCWEILRGKGSLVAAGMRRSATLRKMAAAERKPVDECADYLLHYSPYLQYDEALTEGFPSLPG